jgi:Glycosyl transferase family 90/Glycosyltransferase family 25 (LPS biosynthesis protein)
LSWDTKIPKIVFAAQDRDNPHNFLDTKMRDLGVAPRKYFREVVAKQHPDIIECGNRWINREDMISFKYILDIDGTASTWDATAWKLNSGSVIFKPRSSWCQWFYDDYRAEEHYIEIRDDFSDIGEKFEWCEAHPEECKAMIRRCQALFQEIYSYTNIIEYTKNVLLQLSGAGDLQAVDNVLNIIYINLDKRVDRRTEFESQAAIYGLKCERFPAIYDSFGIVGCTKSHKDVYRMCLERGYETVLIMEDDFEFLVSPEEFQNSIDRVFRSGVNFDVCMLAYNLIESEAVPGCDFLVRVLEAQTASAYIVKRHYLQKLIDLYDCVIPLLETTREHWKYANDQAWKVLQREDNWVCTTTRIGKQRNGFSDNSQTIVRNTY